MGGIKYPVLMKLSRQIWQCKWCESRNIWIHACYITPKQNVEVDEQFRILPRETE